MITINECTIALWHLAKEGDFDFLAHLYRNETTGRLAFQWRFIHADDPDHPQWFSAQQTPGSYPEAFEAAVKGDIIRTMEWAVGYKADELRMEDGNVEAFIEQLLARPYFRVQGLNTC
jgi:hypothetical protein